MGSNYTKQMYHWKTHLVCTNLFSWKKRSCLFACVSVPNFTKNCRSKGFMTNLKKRVNSQVSPLYSSSSILINYSEYRSARPDKCYVTAHTSVGCIYEQDMLCNCYIGLPRSVPFQQEIHLLSKSEETQVHWMKSGDILSLNKRLTFSAISRGCLDKIPSVYTDLDFIYFLSQVPSTLLNTLSLKRTVLILLRNYSGMYHWTAKINFRWLI